MIGLLVTAVTAVFKLAISQTWLVLFAIFALIYFYSTRNFNYWKARGIDGPNAYPFVGNFFSFTKPIPYLYQEYLQKYGKFFGIFRGNQPVLFISDPEVIKRIMVRDFHIFKNRTARNGISKIGQFNLVNARDEPWKRIRSILTPMFTSSKLRKMEPQMKSCTQSVLDSFETYTKHSKEGVTLVAHDAMGNFTMDVIAKCAFATNTNSHSDTDNVFVRHARVIMTFSLIRFLLVSAMPTWLYNWLRNLKFPFLYVPSTDFFVDLSKHLISERRSAKGSVSHDDMLQLMVNAEYSAEGTDEIYGKEDQIEAHHVNTGVEELEAEKKLLKSFTGSKKLSEEEVVAQAIVFFLAGYETTAATMSFALYELAVNPAIEQRLYTEIQEAKKKDPTLSYQTVQNLPFLDAVLSESLRKYPPALILDRQCNADYHIPEINYTLKKGDSVNFPIYAIQHNAEFHKDPSRFNPDRFMPENRDKMIPYTYLPFGGGPRNCIGMRFALTEAKIGLAGIVDRFQIYKTPKTPDQLKIGLCFPLLKTEPIYIGVKKR